MRKESSRITYGLVATALAAVLATRLADTVGAQGPTCKDIPLRFTLYANAIVDPAVGTTVPTALQSDGKGEYLNGPSASALIRVCAGTNDAVLNVSSGKRRFLYVFPRPIDGSVVDDQPSWVPGAYPASGWINVRNITYSKQPFTTHLGSTFSVSVDRATYRLGFDPFVVDAPDLHSDDDLAAVDNVPYDTSPATVYPNYPVTCQAGNMPRWLVRGTTPNSNGLLQVAALHKIPNRGAQIHEGQYSLPFEILVEALQCFTY